MSRYKRRPPKFCPKCHRRAIRAEITVYVSQGGRTMVSRAWVHSQFAFHKGPPPCSVLRTLDEDRQKGDWAL